MQYTYIRATPARFTGKRVGLPDGLMFYNPEGPYTEEMIQQLLDDPVVRRHFGEDKGIIVTWTRMPELNTFNAMLTRSTYYLPSLDHETAGDSFSFYHPPSGKRIFGNVGDVLAGCSELYIADACKDCPKVGRRCLIEHMGYEDRQRLEQIDALDNDDEKREKFLAIDVWPFILPPNRTFVSVDGLRQNITVDERDAEVVRKQMLNLPTTDEEELNQYFAQTPVAGHTFRRPDTTRLREDGMTDGVPLRPPLFHNFANGK